MKRSFWQDQYNHSGPWQTGTEHQTLTAVILNNGWFCPPGDIWRCFVTSGGGGYWPPLVGGGQRCCLTSCNAQDGPYKEELSDKNVNSAARRELRAQREESTREPTGGKMNPHNIWFCKPEGLISLALHNQWELEPGTLSQLTQPWASQEGKWSDNPTCHNLSFPCLRICLHAYCGSPPSSLEAPAGDLHGEIVAVILSSWNGAWHRVGI